MQPPERSRALRGEGVFGKAPRTPCWARPTGVAETSGGNPAILPFDAAALRAAKQLQQHEPGATRLGPKPSLRATHAAQRMTTHTLTGPAAHASPCYAGATTACLAGGRFASRRGRVPAHPPGTHGRGTGVLAPRRLASPQSLSCAKQHVYSLVPRRRRRLLLFYSTRHWYNVRRIVGGDRDLNAPCWLRRYAACFLIINAGVSHGRNGGALPNASTRRRFHPTHVC